MRNWLPLETYQSYKRLNRTGLLRASPPVVLGTGFLALILIGTLLLALPAASSGTQSIGVFHAFFMATSAVTVTGLTVVEPGTALSAFGQTVLISLVQLGGTGFVTLAVVAAVTLGKKLSLGHQAVALEAFNQTSVSKIRRTAVSVFKISLAIEAVAAVVLALWWSADNDWRTAVGLAIFHAIAAFNNAGFSLFPSSLAPFSEDPVVIPVITLSIILGGLGFSVLSDVAKKKRWSTLIPYSKLILIATLVLNVLGFVLIWALERHNPQTLAPLSGHGQILSAWLQSVTSRTAGFTSLSVTHFNDSSTLVMMLLMFIGGGSLSTASGIKVGTFIVLLAAVWSYIFHRKEIVLLKRSVPQETVQKALALLLVTAALAFLGILALTILEDAPFISIVFEVMSALTTTGMTRDLTPHLSTPSHVLLAVLMFAGRLGPLTLVYNLGTQRRSRVRYPETQFQVG